VVDFETIVDDELNEQEGGLERKFRSMIYEEKHTLELSANVTTD